MNNGQSVASAVYQIKSLILKYREFIVYGIVGVLTTAVSWLAAFILKLFLNDQIAWQNVVINTLSWAAAIAFAYPANRKYVFESKNQNVFRECIEFVGSRITTGVMEVAMMSLTVNVMKLDFWISKLLVSVIVIVANYVLSKLVVFKIREK
ncbi:MAG: GtrA family protein [Aeriscardovia sp.]|jgi:Predicted membrane protein|nr:GtrA family protein [Aeriscardovia sp.]MBR3241868.1 GtrA family protein [Parasporobacterium sp.]